MTIDESIEKYRDISNRNSNCWVDCRRKLCRECEQEHKQLAEWLEELKEFREISKKNPFLVDMIKHDRIVRSKAIDDLANTLKENYDYLPQILLQEAFDGYIDEYAEQLKAGEESE